MTIFKHRNELAVKLTKNQASNLFIGTKYRSYTLIIWQIQTVMIWLIYKVFQIIHNKSKQFISSNKVTENYKRTKYLSKYSWDNTPKYVLS